MGLWDKSLRIFKCLCENTTQSVRQLAQQTGLAKSSVHRLQRAMERRNNQPESWVWETAEGRHWLRRLVVATLSPFVLKRGVGVETIREFFVRLGLKTQVGCSPAALRGVLQTLETTMMETAAAWEQGGMAAGEARAIIGAVDATFFAQMMLVFQDLATRRGGSRTSTARTSLMRPGAPPWVYATQAHIAGRARAGAIGGGSAACVRGRRSVLIILYQALQLVTPMRRNPRVGVHGKAVHTGTARSREYRAFPFIPKSWANPSHVLSGPLPKGGKVKGLRTEQQMRYYWGVVVKLIADYTGNDIDTIHEFFKDKFAPRKTIMVQDEMRTVAR